MADPTRLELATSAVTGQRSNQLSYESTKEYYTRFYFILQEKNLDFLPYECYNIYIQNLTGSQKETVFLI